MLQRNKDKIHLQPRTSHNLVLDALKGPIEFLRKGPFDDLKKFNEYSTCMDAAPEKFRSEFNGTSACPKACMGCGNENATTFCESCRAPCACSLTIIPDGIEGMAKCCEHVSGTDIYDDCVANMK